MEIFGFEIRRSGDKKKDEEKNNSVQSFAPKVNDDGAVNVESTATGGSYGYYLDVEGTAKDESDLITRYRSMSLQPEVQQAVDEIVNEAISIDTNEKVVEVVLDDTKLPNKVKKQIIDEFDHILRLLDFSNQGYEIFQRFFVDGRINYHIMIDEENLSRGIVELRYLDPRKLRLIRENETGIVDKRTGIPLKKIKKEYFMYSETGFGSVKSTSSNIGTGNITGFKIAKDTIARVTSGIMNETQTMVLSNLHRAIKPLNQLRILEDATVIYTLTRAPERRIFYVDVGNLPKAKAEQYLADMMARHKNKLQYDSATGEMSDTRKFMTMTEDYWFPRREGSRATEIDTLAGGSSLSDNDNLSYFQKKLYKSLGVPISRLESENMYSFGRVSEMTRDEMRFSKFIRRLRARFSILFDIILEKQLILKGVLTPEEWLEIKDVIRYDFMKDNYFEELKQMEILKEKLSTVRDIEEHVGKYFSRRWVMRNVFFFNDNDIKEMQEEITAERKAGVYKDPDHEVDDSDGDDDKDTDREESPEKKKTDDEDSLDKDDTDDNLEAEEALIINNKNKFEQFKNSRRKYR